MVFFVVNPIDVFFIPPVPTYDQRILVALLSGRQRILDSCIAGVCIGYIRLPQSQKQCVYLSKAYCYFLWEKKFLASVPGRPADPS
jgi:hypothetical protein